MDSYSANLDYMDSYSANLDYMDLAINFVISYVLIFLVSHFACYLKSKSDIFKDH